MKEDNRLERDSTTMIKAMKRWKTIYQNQARLELELEVDQNQKRLKLNQMRIRLRLNQIRIRSELDYNYQNQIRTRSELDQNYNQKQIRLELDQIGWNRLAFELDQNLIRSE